MVAEYRNGKGSAGLLLLEYPTPQLAEQHLRHLEQALSPTTKRAGTTIERKASLLSLVLKPSSAAYGDSLRSAVIYETEVTWNEPHQTVTDPPLVTTLVKIILGTGLFMVVAVVLGVAFGGVRVLAKIFFPGKFLTGRSRWTSCSSAFRKKNQFPRFLLAYCWKLQYNQQVSPASNR